jgi:hypothetical protein
LFKFAVRLVTFVRIYHLTKSSVRLGVALPVATLLALTVTSCGGAHIRLNLGGTVNVPNSTVPVTTVDAEGYELENPNPAEEDGDDLTIYSWGRLASRVEASAVTKVVNRYYDAASKGDGKLGCALTLPSYAQGLPKEYARGLGASYVGNETCQAVMSKLFDRSHREVVGPTKVTSVRVKGNEALVLLHSRTLRFVTTRLRNEGGVWRFTKLIGAQLP